MLRLYEVNRGKQQQQQQQHCANVTTGGVLHKPVQISFMGQQGERYCTGRVGGERRSKQVLPQENT